MGAHHARGIRREESAFLDVALSHPNGRFHADRTAAGKQIVRTAVEAMAAVLGGTQSLHTNGYDEALALPTEQAARTALRTQQILAYESGVAQTVDPFAGSYCIEAFTDEIEKRALAYLDKIAAMGGMLRAIEQGFVQQEIQNAAYEFQRAVDSGSAIIVGVNRFTAMVSRGFRCNISTNLWSKSRWSGCARFAFAGTRFGGRPRCRA